MNAGIADAVDLSWMIAAAINGWASPAILNAYEAERRPITEQVSPRTTPVRSTVGSPRPAATGTPTNAGAASRWAGSRGG